MSQENVELVHEANRRFVAGDFSGLASLYTPDMHMDAPLEWPDGGPTEGRDAVIRQLTRVQEDWEHHTMEVQRERAERDWVVFEVLWTVQAAQSGLDSELTVSAACRVEGPRIAELLFFWKWDEALEAAGLRE
jgi:ketosteroid isomerase-like protein